jgi:hypothetical protein
MGAEEQHISIGNTLFFSLVLYALLLSSFCFFFSITFFLLHSFALSHPMLFVISLHMSILMVLCCQNF